MPPQISFTNLLTLWWFDLFFAVIAAVLGGLYAAGVVRLVRRGDKRPLGRSIAWGLAIVILVLTTQSGVARYAPVLFSVPHDRAHGALDAGADLPGARRARRRSRCARRSRRARRGDRGRVSGSTVILHSRVARFIAHPAIATALFVVSTYALYFTPLFASAMEEHLGHIAMSLHFLGDRDAVLLGDRRGRPRAEQAPLLRPALLLLFVTMPFHAFFAMAIMSMGSVLASDWYDQLGRTWGASSLSDQNTGGAIAWASARSPR